MAGPLGKLCSADPDAQGVQQDVSTRMEGIVSRVRFPISNGPLEGCNNMIKTVQMQAGLRIQGHPILLPQDLGQEQEIPQEPLNRKSQGETDSV